MSLELKSPLHVMLSDYLLTFSRWLARPSAIGMIVPSGTRLTRAMVGAAITSPQGLVVEFGSGTGAITTVLLKTGIEPENVVLIERDAVFHRLLVERFPGVRIIRGDVTDAKLLVETISDSKVTAMVSGLPLLVMSRREITSVLRTICFFLSADGVFVQYTYGRSSPFPEDLVREFGLEGERLCQVWLNFPPATIWRYWRRGAEIPGFTAIPQPESSPRRDMVGLSSE